MKRFVFVLLVACSSDAPNSSDAGPAVDAAVDVAAPAPGCDTTTNVCLDAPATSLISPILSADMEGTWSNHPVPEPATGDAATYLSLWAKLPFTRVEFYGGSSHAWLHFAPQVPDNGPIISGIVPRCPSETGAACAAGSNGGSCPSCPSVQRQGIYVWQSDIDHLNTFAGHESDTRCTVAGLAFGCAVHDHVFWDDYVHFTKANAATIRPSLVLNVLNGTTDDANLQLDTLEPIAHVADISLGVEQSIYTDYYGNGDDEGQSYVNRVTPFIATLHQYAQTHATSFSIHAAVPPIHQSSGHACPGSAAACWTKDVNEQVPSDVGIEQYSYLQIPHTVADDGALVTQIFGANGIAGLEQDWDSYRTAYPGRNMLVGQWNLQGDDLKRDNYGHLGLAEAIYVVRFAFDAALYDVAHAGFFESIKYYNGRNLVDESNAVTPPYDAFAMLAPAFGGAAKLLYSASCPGSADDTCHLYAIESGGASVLYATNFRSTEVDLVLGGARSPAGATTVETISGPSFDASYVDHRATHTVAPGTSHVSVPPKSLVAVKWPTP